MGKLNDLTGRKFGKLTVIERNGSDKHKKAQWLCKCDCGDKITTTGVYLLNGDTKSCGCLQEEEDLSNENFGKVKVIKKDKDIYSPSGKRNSLWLCECECGNRFSTYRQSLIKGYYNEGCNVCKRNKYDLTGEYGIGYTFKGEEFYFDLEDYELVKSYCWYMSSDGYVCSKNDSKSISMHKIIVSEDEVVDHINRCRKDNRKENLRITTYQGNNRNRSKQRNNNSGFIGVYWSNTYNRWMSRVKVDGKNIHLGSFVNKEDAIIARLKGELKYFKLEFSPQRHLFERYNIL